MLRRESLGAQDDRDRPVVHKLDRHPRAEDPGLDRHAGLDDALELVALIAQKDPRRCGPADAWETHSVSTGRAQALGIQTAQVFDRRVQSLWRLALMALLWVIPLQLFARLTDLLDHEVFRVPLNDALDGGRFVSGDDNEPESLLDDSLVFARRDRQLLDAGSVTALTVKRQRSLNAVPLCPFVNPLVDLTEDLFVSCSSVRELHPAMIARTRTRHAAMSAATRREGSHSIPLAPFPRGSPHRDGDPRSTTTYLFVSGVPAQQLTTLAQARTADRTARKSASSRVATRRPRLLTFGG